MKKITSILLFGAFVGTLNAHVKVYDLSLSSGGYFSTSNVGVLPSADLLISAYDSTSSSLTLLRVDPIGNVLRACALPSTSITLNFQSLKIREDRLIMLNPEGVSFSDTTMGGALNANVGSKADADLLSGDTVVMVWGDTLYSSLGTVSLSGFTPISTLRFDVSSLTNIRYGVLTFPESRHVVVAHPSGSLNAILLTYLSVSGGTLSYDSTVSLTLPSGWIIKDGSILKVVALPSGGVVVGFTADNGVSPYPAFLTYDGTPSAFLMDSMGILTDIRPTSEGLVITSNYEGTPPISFAQIVPIPTSPGDTSLKGYLLRDVYTDGGVEFTSGHYAAVGRANPPTSLRLVYTNFNLTDTAIQSDTRTWSTFALTKSTLTLGGTSVSISPTSSTSLCSPVLFTSTPVYVDDTVAPVLNPPFPDSVISAYDTVVFVFSKPMDPATFQNGTEVRGYGTLKRPVATSSFCTGTICYLIVNATGNDSISVKLTGFITDTSGVPLAPASRMTFNIRVLPVRPRVIFTQPDSGEINVPLNASVGVWFSTGIDVTTVNTYTVDITDGTVSYPFTVSCPFNNMCVLDPVGDFPPSANITVSLTGGIRDTFSQPLFPKVVTFRTVEEDTLSPRVAMTAPDSGDIGIPRNFALSVLFTKPMDTTTVPGGVSVLGSSSGSHTFSVFCPTLKNCVIRPLSAFLPNEVVTVRFNSSIRDTFNRSLVPKTVVFQVGATLDNIPPNVSIVAPPDDTVEVFHPITSPLKAAVWDNSGILMASWIVGSETHHTPLSCSGLPYVASDTTCVDISELPSDTFVVKAIAYDLANTQSVDSIILIVHDTVRPKVSFTEPANGDMAVSPYTDVKITFTEPLDTTVFPSSAVSVTVGTSPVSFSHSWNSPYTLRLAFSEPLPWDSTVTVRLDSLKDLSGNLLVPYTFSFRIVGETHVNVVWIEMKPETVFVGNRDSVKVTVVATSEHPIARAIALVGDRDSVDMRAVDGVYDEPTETLSVWLKTENLRAGKHNVKVKAYNRYVFGTSQPKELYVLDVPLLSPENVYVYPSPVKDHGRIRVVVGEPTTVTVEVFDLKYRRVLYDRQTFTGASVYEEDLPNLPVGVYLLRVKAGDMTVNKWFAVVGKR